MLGPDIGREDGPADRKETDVATGKEVVGCRLLAARYGSDDGDQDGKVGADDGPVERFERGWHRGSIIAGAHD